MTRPTLAHTCLTLGLCSIAGSCTSFEDKLRREREIPELHALGRSYDVMRARKVVVQSRAAPGAPIDIAFHEVGSEDRERVIVAVHGIVSDHRVWRYVAGGLGEEHAVWSIDLPGCGESEIPHPDEHGPDAYSPTWLAMHVLDALRSRLAAHARPVRLTLVGHSLGGGVLLRLLGDAELRERYSDVLAAVDGAVLLSPLDFGFGKADPTLLDVARITDAEMTVGIATGVVRQRVAESTYRGVVFPDRIPWEEFRRTYEILTDPDRRHAVQWMLRSMHFDAEGRVVWSLSREWVDDYERIDVPCLILWGEQDEVLPRASGYELITWIRGAKLGVVYDAKHSLPSEDPVLCTELIREFLTEDFDSREWHTYHDRSATAMERRSDLQLGQRASQRVTVSQIHPKPAPSVPSTVSVVLGADLQRTGVRYLSDALRMVPGAEVQRLSSTESSVAFRGYVDSSSATQGTLGLLDGRQVYNQYLGNVLWDQVPVRIEDVERIEVIRGPGSFIHGPNAMHGVVSIETRSPLDYERDTVSAVGHVGSYDSVVAGATVVNRTSNTGFKTSVQWDDIDQFDASGRDARDQLFFESAFETQLDGDPEHVLGLKFGASEQKFDILLPSLEQLPSTTLENRAHELFSTVSYRNGDLERGAFQSFVSWTGFDSISEPQQYYAPFALDLDTIDVDLRGTWALESHFVTVGGGYRHSTFETDDRDVSDGRHGVDQGWAFAQDEFKVSEDVSLTYGARVDLHSVTSASFSPRAAAVWEFVDDHFARASAGRGFRNPALRELWFNMPVVGVPSIPGTVTIAGNEELDPESLTSFELGYFGSWGAGVGEGLHELETGISAFYNLVDDLISFESDPADPLRVLPRNQDDELAYGFELEGRYVFSASFASFANYSFTIREMRGSGVDNELTPRHKINAGVTCAREGLNAMLWAHYYDDTSLFGVHIPSYVLLNGSLSYTFPLSQDARGQAFVRAFNLLDDDHREHPEGDAYGLILSLGMQFDW